MGQSRGNMTSFCPPDDMYLPTHTPASHPAEEGDSLQYWGYEESVEILQMDRLVKEV
jgi:hypothetical protein